MTNLRGLIAKGGRDAARPAWRGLLVALFLATGNGWRCWGEDVRCEITIEFPVENGVVKYSPEIWRLKDGNKLWVTSDKTLLSPPYDLEKKNLPDFESFRLKGAVYVGLGEAAQDVSFAIESDTGLYFCPIKTKWERSSVRKLIVVFSARPAGRVKIQPEDGSERLISNVCFRNHSCKSESRAWSSSTPEDNSYTSNLLARDAENKVRFDLKCDQAVLKVQYTIPADVLKLGQRVEVTSSQLSIDDSATEGSDFSNAITAIGGASDNDTRKAIENAKFKAIVTSEGSG